MDGGAAHVPTLPLPTSPADARTRMEESLKRSVTIVFWYKPHSAPIRLHEEVPTFPLLQLSQFPQLVADLALSPTSYVDAYNPRARTWEQQTVSAVCVVQSEQRLLFRTRMSLLQGMADAECPDLHDEIALQQLPPLSGGVGKRVAPSDAGPAPPPPKQPRTEPAPPLPTPTPESESAASSSSSSASSASTRAGISKRSSVPRDLFHHFMPPAGAALPLPIAHASPPPLAKRWPNDYTVCELAAGFRTMDAVLTSEPGVTQRAAFERAFGCRYVKSTVCRHRGVWRRAGRELRETYERMGADRRAVWTVFLRQVEGGTMRTDQGQSKGKGKGRGGGRADRPLAGEMTVVMAPQMAQMGGAAPSQPSSSSLLPRPRSPAVRGPIMGSLGPPPPGFDPNNLRQFGPPVEKSGSEMSNGLSSEEAGEA